MRKVKLFSNSKEKSHRQGSLVHSLLKIIAIIFCLSAVGVFVFNNFMTKISVEESTKSSIKETVQYYNLQLSNWLQIRVQQLQLLQHSVQQLSASELTRENLQPLVESSTEYATDYGVLSDYVVLPDKTMISGDGWIPDAGYDPTQNDYYTQAQTTDVYVSQPYVDASTKDFVITISVPLTINGQFHGIVGRDVRMQEVQSILTSYASEDGSYLYLIDGSGSILSHKNPNFQTSDSKAVTVSDAGLPVLQEALNKNTLSKDYDGAKKYYYAQQDSLSGWIVGLVYPESIVQQEIFQQASGSLVIFAAAVIVGLAVMVGIMRKKFAPIAQITQAAQLLENGNFNIDVQTNSNDELGVLSNSFHHTGTYLRTIICEISEVLQQLSQGNLNVSITQEYRGEFVAVEQAINNIIAQMNEVIIQIEDTSNHVASGAAQTADNAQSLSESSMNQAEQVEKISRDMSRIKNAVEETTARTVNTGLVTQDVSQKLEESKARMEQMMEEMYKINQSSSEIGKIIKTIEDIAFQTNILALNAAVEAARAGVAGKGFAVVADEVRELANKSALAAQNTTKLIETSIQTVNRGSEVAHQTEQALLEAVASANQVVEETEQIVELSQAQSRDLDGITQTVSTFSSAIQTNSATAEENAATSEEMAGQAQILQSLLEKFTVKSVF